MLPPKYSGTFYWLIAAALYALAKLLEFYDSAIYSASSILSGHTLKHLAAAVACVAILRYFQMRRPIAAPDMASRYFADVKSTKNSGSS